jgi:hypothetical protein
MSLLSFSRCGRYVATLAVVAVTALVSACGPFHTGGQEPARLVFANESLDQATVYVVGPGRDFTRIGTIFAGQTDTLTVPADLAVRGTLNIVARMLARPNLAQTGPVSMQPGAWYTATLPSTSNLISFLPGP